MLELPPLRERLEDLPELADALPRRASRASAARRRRRLSDEALELLAAPRAGRATCASWRTWSPRRAIFAEGAVIEPEAFAHVRRAAGAAASGEVRRRRRSPAPRPRRRRAAEVRAAPPATGAAAPPRPLDFYELARQRGISLKDLRHEVEMQCIRRALLDAKGNISEAARLLKMKRSRLSQIVNAEPR